MGQLIAALFIGVGATALFDLWCVAVAVSMGGPLPSWTLPGRWFAEVARGRVFHADMGAVASVPGETVIGWVGHYLIGVIYAAVLIAWQGPSWLARPVPGPAVIVGVVTVLAGWLLMSPGMGNGIAAARAEQPWRVRRLQLAAHVVFGLGLWAFGWAFVALG